MPAAVSMTTSPVRGDRALLETGVATRNVEAHPADGRLLIADSSYATIALRRKEVRSRCLAIPSGHR